MTRAEEQNKAVHELLNEITQDKEHYAEYKAIRDKLEFISLQINKRVTNELKDGTDEPRV